MPALSSQRCFNHPVREAVARCPECAKFYCRECITEHEDRVICANCLRELTRKAEKKPRRWPVALLTAGRVAFGILAAWVAFYFVARSLLAIPSSFHDAELWSLLNPDALELEDGGK